MGGEQLLSCLPRLPHPQAVVPAARPARGTHGACNLAPAPQSLVRLLATPQAAASRQPHGAAHQQPASHQPAGALHACALRRACRWGEGTGGGRKSGWDQPWGFGTNLCSQAGVRGDIGAACAPSACKCTIQTSFGLVLACAESQLIPLMPALLRHPDASVRARSCNLLGNLCRHRCVHGSVLYVGGGEGAG